MGVFRWFGVGLAGFFTLNLLGEEDASSRYNAARVDQASSSIVKPDRVTALPIDRDKQALLDDVAKPAALRSPTSPPVTRAPTHVYVSGSRVNLRDGPGVSHARIGAFDRGTKLVLLEQQGGWMRVNGAISGTSTTGWMSGDYLSKTKPVPAAVPAPVRTRTASVPSGSDISRANKTLISQSISTYPGSCPCPYNRDRSGRRCGKRSAWSKPGGRSPLCYDSDVTRSHLSAYFRRVGKQYP